MSVPMFPRNTGDDAHRSMQSQECQNRVDGAKCGRLKVVHPRGLVKVCATCDSYKTWPDFQPGGRK